MTDSYTILFIIFAFVLGLIVRNYLPSYFNEKGKNLATKEDITEITTQVEQVKYSYNSELENTKISLQKTLEELKSTLSHQSHLIVKKREVYDSMVKSLSVFFKDRDSEEKKSKFLDDYASFWLWASDDAIHLFNTYVDINISFTDKGQDLIGEKTIEAFNNLVFELRKDAGHQDTKVTGDDFRKLKF